MPAETFDTHCHLTFDELRTQQPRVIADAVQAGVSRMITVACVPEAIDPALALAQQYDGLRVAAGFHPHQAARITPSDLRRLTLAWQTDMVVAAGEMGLDYHYDFSPRDVQASIFRRQLELAAETDLPVVIHCRQAHDEVVRILTTHGYVDKPVVFHCFSGTADEAAELRANGWWTSFTGIVTFKNATDVQQACAQTPADQIMFETDSPYLAPEPVRRMRPNEPQNLPHVIRFAAALRSQTFEDLAAASTANAIRFFGLDRPSSDG